MAHLFQAAVVAITLATAAVAQVPSGPTQGLREITDPARPVTGWDLAAGRVKGMGVHGPKGNRIGAAEGVLEDAAGQPAAVVVRYRSAVGEGAVAVPFGQIDLRGDHLVTKLAAEQLGAMPIWQR